MISIPQLVRRASHLLRNLNKFRPWVLGGISALALATALHPAVRDSLFVQKIEGYLIDIRYRLRSERDQPKTGHPQIAIVGINQSSLDQGQLQKFAQDSPAIGLMAQGGWPFPRATYAYVIDRLFELGARVVAFDILFPTEREGDQEFAAAARRNAGRVVISSTTISENKDTEKGKRNDSEARTLVLPNSTLTAAVGSEQVGYVLLRKDNDGVIRRMETHTSALKEQGHPELAQGNDLVRFAPLAVSKFLGQQPESKSFFINYLGGPATFHFFPIEEIFNDRLMKTPMYENGNVFRDKLVFVGPIAETFQDQHPSPMSAEQPMPGVEIHAHAAATLLDRNLIRQLPEHSDSWIAFGMVVIAFSLFRRAEEKVIARILTGGAISFGYCALCYYLFSQERIMLPAALPLMSLIGVGGCFTVVDFATEQFERAHVRSVLDKYVSKNVASLVISQANSFETALRGQSKSVSVLFSDIRGFTTLSESRSPELLVAQLNEYFLPMVDKVLTQGGTLQKFIGDAIMAVWGDTHSLGVEVDACGAVRAALQMREALKIANAGWRGRPDRVELSTGIGINHGHVVVGEVGHPKRMEFTVLGDGVNLAARLESSTKQFGCDILVGETAEALTREHFVFRKVDRAVFKGKTAPIDVFTPLGEKGMEIPAWLNRYHEAVALYQHQDFEVAKARFGEVLEELEGGDFLCKMYQKRCDILLADRPAPDWDGSWVLSEK
ncbi:MAG: Adenylate cyclase 2 [Verrucomicrobiota bacterium]|jgi:adenylate cyclase